MTSREIKPVGLGGLPPRRDELPQEVELEGQEVATPAPLPRWGSNGGSARNNPYEIESVFDDLGSEGDGNNILSDKVTSRIKLIKSLIDERLVDGKIVLFVRDDNPSLPQYVAHYTKAKVGFGKLVAQGYPLVLVPNSLLSALELPIELQQVPAIVVYEHGKVLDIKYAYMHEEGVEEFLYHKLGRTGVSPFIIDEPADVPTPKAVSAMGPFTVSPQNVPKKESPFTIVEDGQRDPNETLQVAEIVAAQTPIYKIPLNPLSEDIFRVDSSPSLVSKVSGALSAWLSREVPARTAALTGGPSAERLAELSAERPNPPLKETLAPAIAAVASMFPAFKARLSSTYEPDLSRHDKPTLYDGSKLQFAFSVARKKIDAAVEVVSSSVDVGVEKAYGEISVVKDKINSSISKPNFIAKSFVVVGGIIVASQLYLSKKNQEKSTSTQKDNGGEVALVEKAEVTPEKVENIIKLSQPEKVDFDAKHSDWLKVEAPSGVAYYIKAGEIVKTFDGVESAANIKDLLKTVETTSEIDKDAAKAMILKAVSKIADANERELSSEQLKELSKWFNDNRDKLEEKAPSQRAVGE